MTANSLVLFHSARTFPKIMAKVLQSVLVLCFITSVLSAALEVNFMHSADISEKETFELLKQKLESENLGFANGNDEASNQISFYANVTIKFTSSALKIIKRNEWNTNKTLVSRIDMGRATKMEVPSKYLLRTGGNTDCNDLLNIS